MIGIYQLRSLTTGKIYVGQSKNIKERMKYHRWDSKKQNKSEWPLYIDFNKYGFDDFVLEVLEECVVEKLDEREELYIKKFEATNPEKGYNFCSSAIPFKDEKLREVIKPLGSKAIKDFNKKAWANEDYRKMMSEKSRKNQLERLKNPEYLEEKTQQLKKATDKMKMKVGKYDEDLNLLEVYDGVRIAERANNLPNDMVGKVCRGSKYRKTAGGFKWKYIPEEEV